MSAVHQNRSSAFRSKTYFIVVATPTKYVRSEEHTSELQSRSDLVCRLLLEKKKKNTTARLLTTQRKRGSLRGYSHRPLLRPSPRHRHPFLCSPIQHLLALSSDYALARYYA